MTWVKGQSGNPDGRPKVALIGAAQVAARLALGKAVERLERIAQSAAEDKDAVAATRLLAQIAGVPLTPESPKQPDSQPPAPPPQLPSESLSDLLRQKGMEQ